MNEHVNRFLHDTIRKIPPVNRLVHQRDSLAESMIGAKTEVYELRLERLRLENEIESLKAALQEKTHLLERFGDAQPWVPNGHFYSPIAPRHEIEAYCAETFTTFPRAIPGVDLRESEQVAFLDVVRGFYADLPFKDEKVDGLRYQFANSAFRYTDGIMLNSMVRHWKPRRVIEVGSGHSSCMLLDTNEIWFGNSIDCSFIEPYPELLHSLVKPGDLDRIKVYPNRVQDVPLSVFEALEPNDIFFVDSTHVSRAGSDVNHILFNILPILKPGVIVHFHDIPYPFEYFEVWLKEGRSWNEAYMLRAFLQNNHDYEMLMFNSFVNYFHKDYLTERMPLLPLDPGGSVWLRKAG